MEEIVIPVRLAPKIAEARHEYRIVVPGLAGTIDGTALVTSDAKEAGEAYRHGRDKWLKPGQSIELQRRPIGEWETVERAEAPAPDAPAGG